MWQQENAGRLTEEGGQSASSVGVFEALAHVLPDNALIAGDIGNNTHSFRRYFETKGQRVMLSGYLGSIGFALLAPMGAWAATRDFNDLNDPKLTSIFGDGGLAQYATELTTFAKYGVNVTDVLLHNAELGKIAKEPRSVKWPVCEAHWSPSFSSFAGRIARKSRAQPISRLPWSSMVRGG